MFKKEMAKWIMTTIMIGTSLFLTGCLEDETIKLQESKIEIDVEYQTGDVIVDNSQSNMTKDNLIQNGKEAYDIAYAILSKKCVLEKYKKAFVVYDKKRGQWKIEYAQDGDMVGGGIEIVLDEKDSKVLSINGTE